MLRYFMLIAAASFALAAAPVDCSNGTLADYTMLPSAGCRIGGIVVSGFTPSTALPGATALAPTAVTVTPLTDPLNQGLLFGFSAIAETADILQSVFQFTVISNAGPLGGALLTLSGASAMIDGVTTTSADICFGAFTAGVCNSPPTTLIAFAIDGDSELFSRSGFSSVQGAAVLFDAVIDGGSTGSAALGSAAIRFQTVPEPSTYATVLTAIGAILAARRRRGR